MDRKSIFENIYENKKWGSKGTLSGEGTRPEAAKEYVQFVTTFLESHPEIKTILDLGHGDWQMWPKNYFDNYDYTGIDITPSVVEMCNREYGNPHIKFIEADFLEIELPQADLLLIKDLLIHLSNEDIKKSLGKLGKFKYSIVVTDIESKGWRVFAGNIKREFDKSRNIMNLIASPFRASNKHYLRNDIETGSYHWVELLDSKWALQTYDLSIIGNIEFSNRGLTPGRSTVKRIYLLGSNKSEIFK